MKKKIWMRGVLGLPLGIAIGYVITILGSLGWGQGYYSPCVPELIVVMGNEIRAVVLQTVLCGLLGVVFGAGSVIWEIEQWSIARQTGTYFLVAAAAMMPVAYFSYWMEHSVRGFLIYFCIFTVIFIVIWLVQYMFMRRDVNRINSKLK